jgi:hypothetical protein
MGNQRPSRRFTGHEQRGKGGACSEGQLRIIPKKQKKSVVAPCRIPEAPNWPNTPGLTRSKTGPMSTERNELRSVEGGGYLCWAARRAGSEITSPVRHATHTHSQPDRLGTSPHMHERRWIDEH